MPVIIVIDLGAYQHQPQTAFRWLRSRPDGEPNSKVLSYNKDKTEHH